MRKTLAYIFLLLFLNARFVRTAPAPPGTGTDTGASLIQLNNLAPNFTGTTSKFVDLLMQHPNDKKPDLTCPYPSLSSSLCPRRNDNNQLSDGDVRTRRFAVPGTTTVLNVFYCPGHPIDRDLIRETIAIARMHMNRQMAIYGDGPLQPVDDPYTASVIAGMTCTMEIISLRRPRTQVIPNRLTYQTTLNALSGLFWFLVTEDHAVSAVVEVVDPGLTGSMIRIGLMSISLTH